VACSVLATILSDQFAAEPSPAIILPGRIWLHGPQPSYFRTGLRPREFPRGRGQAKQTTIEPMSERPTSVPPPLPPLSASLIAAARTVCAQKRGPLQGRSGPRPHPHPHPRSGDRNRTASPKPTGPAGRRGESLKNFPSSFTYRPRTAIGPTKDDRTDRFPFGARDGR